MKVSSCCRSKLFVVAVVAVAVAAVAVVAVVFSVVIIVVVIVVAFRCCRCYCRCCYCCLYLQEMLSQNLQIQGWCILNCNVNTGGESAL